MSYKVLYQAGEDEIEEKKSRFIAHTLPVNSEDEAVAFLNKIKKNTGMHDTTATHTPSDATMNVPAAAMTENHPALPAVQSWTYCSGKKSTTASW
ncbi:MAG: hypothetical protein ACLTDV_10255 [Eubacterium sp.]